MDVYIFFTNLTVVHELLIKSCKYVKQENYESIFMEVNKVVSVLIFLFCVHFMRFEPASKLSIWGVARLWRNQKISLTPKFTYL